MAVEVDVQVACDDNTIPAEDTIRSWVEAAVDGAGRHGDDALSVAVRIVDADEIQTLNRLYREQDKVTNVLSFPAGQIEGLPDDAPRLLGDVVVCAAIVADEAAEQGKQPEHHWGHMLVHGTLHLLGFDHGTDDEAEEMESQEVAILAGRNVTNPYEGS
jgi:probable rRNA maturation factor